MKTISIFPTPVLYGSAGPFTITQTQIDNYIAAHPLNGATFAASMEQIYTQFYLHMFMLYDNFEEFATNAVQVILFLHRLIILVISQVVKCC